MNVISDGQKDYIRKVYLSKTDQEIAEEIGMSVFTVRQFRATEKLNRKESKKVESKLTLDKHKFDLNAKKHEEIFKNTYHFTMLQKSYTPDEIDYYMGEFAAYSTEVEEEGSILKPSERRALDQLIRTQIDINRLVAKERTIHETMATTEDTVENAAQMRQLEFVLRELRGLRDTFSSLQQSLTMTRQEKAKKKGDARINALTILQELKDEKTRSGIGYWTSLTDKSMNKILKSWRESGNLLDSEALVDGNTETKEEPK